LGKQTTYVSSALFFAETSVRIREVFDRMNMFCRFDMLFAYGLLFLA